MSKFYERLKETKKKLLNEYNHLRFRFKQLIHTDEEWLTLEDLDNKLGRKRYITNKIQIRKIINKLLKKFKRERGYASTHSSLS